jgi:hypothetical protein
LREIKKEDYSGYLWADKGIEEKIPNNFTDSSIDISDCAFVDVKKLKLPKLEKGPSDNTAYQVFEGYGYKKYYTPQDLDTLVTNREFKGVEPDDDWYSTVKTVKELNSRTIGSTKDYGNRCSFWTANSIKMIDAMKELGWITPEMPEYRDKMNEIKDADEKRRRIENANYRAQSLFFGLSCGKRTIKIIQSNDEKFQRLEKLVKAIGSESSVRSRILGTMRDYNMKISRNDLRKILRMKD